MNANDSASNVLASQARSRRLLGAEVDDASEIVPVGRPIERRVPVRPHGVLLGRVHAFPMGFKRIVDQVGCFQIFDDIPEPDSTGGGGMELFSKKRVSDNGPIGHQFLVNGLGHVLEVAIETSALPGSNLIEMADRIAAVHFGRAGGIVVRGDDEVSMLGQHAGEFSVESLRVRPKSFVVGGHGTGVGDVLVALPAGGVYACRAYIDKKSYPAMTNIGSRPTFGGGQQVVEVYLLDYKGDLYGREITIDTIGRLRDEKKFDTAEQLKEQIAKDVKQGKDMLKTRGGS